MVQRAKIDWMGKNSQNIQALMIIAILVANKINQDIRKILIMNVVTDIKSYVEYDTESVVIWRGI